MPELPEVETIRQGLIDALLQQKLQQVIVYEPRLRWPVSSKLSEILSNQTLTAISRRGKYLIFAFSKQQTLLIHLGMSGRLLILPRKHSLIRHEHVVFEFANAKSLCFVDPRRFGSVLLAGSDPLKHKLLCKLGPEPLSSMFNAKYLWRVSRGRRVAVKLFIMNAHVVVGVGNIYANEALFGAGIHPTKVAQTLTLQEYTNLVQAIKQVLRKALNYKGTTIRDYATSDNSSGNFAKHLQVYGRSGKPCVICGTTLQEIRLGQRSTYFCPKCQ